MKLEEGIQKRDKKFKLRYENLNKYIKKHIEIFH